MQIPYEEWRRMWLRFLTMQAFVVANGCYTSEAELIRELDAVIATRSPSVPENLPIQNKQTKP